MILRKPYAFFIKNFKIFHLIMTVLFIYLVYKTSVLNAFLNNYISTTTNVLGQDLSSMYFSSLMFIFPLIIIVMSIIIGSVMLFKKKTMILYVINLVVNIATLIMYNFALSTITSMEYKVVDIRPIKACNDILFILFLVQILMTIIMIVRATGFDIKKFDFAQDLQELKIEEKDSEEIEVELRVNTQKVKRNIKQKIRFAKYFYLEHKFTINIVAIIVIVVGSFSIFYNRLVLNKSYSQNVTFPLTGYNMVIKNAYITNKDYQGKVIDEYSNFIILEASIKSTYQPKKIGTGRISILIDDSRYYSTIKYNSKFSDIGIGYYNEEISSDEFEKYLFIFQVPKNINTNKIKFSYVDQLINTSFNPKYIKVDLTLKSIDKNIKTTNYKLNEELDFSDSVLENEKLIITSSEVQNEFKEQYTFNLNNQKYKSYEYIKKNIENYDTRTILKIKSNFDILELLKKHGTIKYTIDGVEKSNDVEISQLKPTKYKSTNTYYYEVNNEILNATKIDIEFKIRNKIYVYNIKGGN